MNLASVLAACERAEAAYIMDPVQCRTAFEALGQTWVGQYQSGSVQAALTLREGAAYVSISGTRFSDGQLGDLVKDLNIDDLDIGQGACVAQGAFEGLFSLWKWVYAGLPATCPIWVEGHSLGGWRTYYTPLFVPSARLAGMHCFESPKAANAKFWESYDREDTVSVVHERDVFFHYPWVSTWGISQPPRNHLWLHDGQLESVLPQDIPVGLSREDHEVSGVVAALRAQVPAA